MENIKNEEVSEKRFLTLNEMLVKYETAPKTNFLWSGIKEKSFGLVFGPSKSGKTIFCENLAMSIAMGKDEFFEYPLDGIPKKVLFVGLEEFWLSRIERNRMQFEVLNEEEQLLIGENYRFQPIDFSKRIVRESDYDNLINTIMDSEAEVVFIDSITRMNLGQLENSADSEKLMQKLREVCYDLKITLICIHHTTKMFDCPITMDKIKGSAVFAQESDFAIGVSRTSKNHRYVKNVFFRYAPDDSDIVKEFEIDNSCWLNHLNDVDEDELLARTDKRRATEKPEIISSYLDNNSTCTYTKKELYNILSNDLGIKERQYGSYLQNLEKERKIFSPSLGNYASVNYKYIKNEGDDERRV
ncbi:AAA family ATPase [Lutibacter sp.]|uniref:AAA family ATPase n=1 Tax=Lutibacter sp. TaxID=1925666 RepID=UPI002735AAC7|nr:AAA family ATPase [Lutibacter sp.]MDP3314376.1 AAA family ATPase [Lutibacter sp.]